MNNCGVHGCNKEVKKSYGNLLTGVFFLCEKHSKSYENKEFVIGENIKEGEQDGN